MGHCFSSGQPEPVEGWTLEYWRHFFSFRSYTKAAFFSDVINERVKFTTRLADTSLMQAFRNGQRLRHPGGDQGAQWITELLENSQAASKKLEIMEAIQRDEVSDRTSEGRRRHPQQRHMVVRCRCSVCCLRMCVCVQR